MEEKNEEPKKKNVEEITTEIILEKKKEMKRENGCHCHIILSEEKEMKRVVVKNIIENQNQSEFLISTRDK